MMRTLVHDMVSAYTENTIIFKRGIGLRLYTMYSRLRSATVCPCLSCQAASPHSSARSSEADIPICLQYFAILCTFRLESSLLYVILLKFSF